MILYKHIHIMSVRRGHNPRMYEDASLADPIPPSPDPGDDEQERQNAFDDFVNHQLNFDAQSPQSDDLFDEDDPENDLDLGAAQTGEELLPFSPFRRRLSDDARVPPSFVPLSAGRTGFPRPNPPPSGPPRVSLPPPTDRRWVNAVYVQNGTLTIYSLVVLNIQRVWVLHSLDLKLDRRIRVIPNIMPGWVAVELNMGLTEPVRGFVRQRDLRLRMLPRVTGIPSLIHSVVLQLIYRPFTQTILILCAILLLAAGIVSIVAPEILSEPGLTSMQQQITEQQRQLDHLNEQLLDLRQREGR